MRLCDWLFRASVRDGDVLDYATTYFQLGPIERRIYEVARSTFTDGEALEIDLATFGLQTGFQNYPTFALPYGRSPGPTASQIIIRGWLNICLM